MNKWFVFTVSVCIIDLILPFVLGIFYPNYNHLNTVMSVLGGKESPVRITYNIWMGCLGFSFLAIGIHLFSVYKETKLVTSLILLVITVAYAIFDCLASSVFSIGDSKEMVTVPEKIHGYGSAIGCTLFLFAGLVAALLIWKSHIVLSRLILADFVLALATFILFVSGQNIGEEATGWIRVFRYEGLWQRVSFIFMYIPYIGLTMCE